MWQARNEDRKARPQTLDFPSKGSSEPNALCASVSDAAGLLPFSDTDAPLLFVAILKRLKI